MAEMVLAQYVSLFLMMIVVAVVGAPLVAAIDGWRLPSARPGRFATEH